MRTGNCEAEEHIYSFNHNQNLTPVSYEKDFEVINDKKLSFEKHIEEKINKPNKIVSLIFE